MIGRFASQDDDSVGVCGQALDRIHAHVEVLLKGFVSLDWRPPNAPFSGEWGAGRTEGSWRAMVALLRSHVPPPGGAARASNGAELSPTRCAPCGRFRWRISA